VYYITWFQSSCLESLHYWFTFSYDVMLALSFERFLYQIADHLTDHLRNVHGFVKHNSCNHRSWQLVEDSSPWNIHFLFRVGRTERCYPGWAASPYSHCCGHPNLSKTVLLEQQIFSMFRQIHRSWARFALVTVWLEGASTTSLALETWVLTAWLTMLAWIGCCEGRGAWNVAHINPTSLVAILNLIH
jgi:hypothetical protein